MAGHGCDGYFVECATFCRIEREKCINHWTGLVTSHGGFPFSPPPPPPLILSIGRKNVRDKCGNDERTYGGRATGTSVPGSINRCYAFRAATVSIRPVSRAHILRFIMRFNLFSAELHGLGQFFGSNANGITTMSIAAFDDGQILDFVRACGQCARFGHKEAHTTMPEATSEHTSSTIGRTARSP